MYSPIENNGTLFDAAKNLFDNHLGGSDNSPNLYTGRYIWANLGEKIYGSDAPIVRWMREEISDKEYFQEIKNESQDI